MQLNLTEYLESEGRTESFRVSYEKEMLELLPERIPLAKPFTLELSVANQGKGSVRIEGTGELFLIFPCDRCLADCEETVPLRIDELITQQQIRDSEGKEAELPSFLDGYQIDTDRMIEDAAAVELPTKILCREDCKGICPVCGCNRNEKTCDCETFVPHPGFADIGKIFAESRPGMADKD